MASIDSVRIVFMQSSSMSVCCSAVGRHLHDPTTSVLPDVADSNLDNEKRIAAEAAAELVRDGMRVGLGTGSTVAHLLPAFAARGLKDLRCVATSVATEEQARELGIPVEDFDRLDRLDIAIDGADQIAPDHWLVKGGGGAHTREKIVAATAERFVVIADSSKTVDRIAAPIPLELSAFGLASTLARISCRARRGGAAARHAREARMTV